MFPMRDWTASDRRATIRPVHEPEGRESHGLEVHFTLWLSQFGAQGLNHSGHAVRVGDEWKVSRDTWCGLVRMIGVECPPPPD
jgi:hypothetical protein